MSGDNRYDAHEYLDLLVTTELAAKIAMIDGRPVNKAIRACWFNLRRRAKNKLNINIFDGMSMQFLPHGALCMLRRNLDETISNNKL